MRVQRASDKRWKVIHLLNEIPRDPEALRLRVAVEAYKPMGRKCGRHAVLIVGGQRAVAESFFPTLELELLAGNVFASHREANIALVALIEHWYHTERQTERQHSTLPYQRPKPYEQQLRRMVRAA